MKKVIIALSILAVIIGAGAFEQVYVSKTLDNFIERTEALKVALTVSNNALEEAEELEKWWIEKKQYLEALSPHNFFMDITYSVYEVIGNIENDEIPQALTRIEILKGQISNLNHILCIHWEHVI